MPYEEASALYFKTLGVLYYVLQREPSEEEIGAAYNQLYRAQMTQTSTKRPLRIPLVLTPA